MSSTTRVQFNVPDHKLAKLDEMQGKLGLSTRKDLFDTAMALLKWAVREKEKGFAIATVNEEGPHREIVLPALEDIKEPRFEKRLFKVSRDLNVPTNRVVEFLVEEGYGDALTGDGFNASIVDEEAYLALRAKYATDEELSPDLDSDVPNGGREEEESELLVCEGRGARATAKYNGNGNLVVLQGSTAALETTDGATKRTEARRQELKEKGVLQTNDENTALVFKRDEEFSSPSPAAQVVLGRSANGRTEWKTEDGRPLKQIQPE